MNIVERTTEKIKELLSYTGIDEIMWMVIIIFITLSSFSLGMLYERRSFLDDNPVHFEYNQEALELWNTYENIKDANTNYFASQNGSIVYPVGCSKGNRIKEENKIFFINVDQALELGYREVEGC
jgi:hypothetical protein